MAPYRLAECTNLAVGYDASFIRVANGCDMSLRIVVMFGCTGLQDDIKQTDRALFDRTSRQWISGDVASATSHIRATAILVLSIIRNCEIHGWGCPRLHNALTNFR